jgi:arylesterase/paraoxonase
LLLSCDPQRHNYSTLTGNFPPSLPPGELWVFDPSAPETPPRQVIVVQGLGEGLADFRPLGISATSTRDGYIRVFVANQAKSGPRVEVLDLDLELSSAEARHVATIQHPLIYSPNSVAAVNATGFYVSNDVYFARGSSMLGVAAEVITAAPGGSLVYVSMQEPAPVVKRATRLALANGLAVDTGNNRVWAVSSPKGVYSFTYNPADPSQLVSEQFMRTASLGDNLILSPDGEVYVSGQTNVRALAASVGDAAAPKPGSLVARLVPKGKGTDVANAALRKEEWRWESVFEDDGAFYGGVSSAAVLEGGKFVASSLVEKGVLVCGEVPKVGRGEKEKEMKDEL